MKKLDYSLKTMDERIALVEEILQEQPNPSSRYLQILGDYLVFCNKEEQDEKHITTKNHYITVAKRETSLEGLSQQFENGEDGVYSLVAPDRYSLFRPKKPITEEDRLNIPELAQATEAIAAWEKILETATGRDALIAKNAIIEARKEQYTIKESRSPICARGRANSRYAKTGAEPSFDSYITFDENGYCVPHGVTLINPEVCSAIMRNYSSIRYAQVRPQTAALLDEFEQTAKKALKPYPIYQTLMEDKIQGLQNHEIQQDIYVKHGILHSLEYISSLWRKKIPAVIASQAEDDYLDWYYLNIEKGNWKKCSRCGKIKLAHNKYFSRNTTSRDGFYSICKECRNKKEEEGN